MYTFKLQAVLDHRHFIEDNLKKELAEFRQQAMAAQQQLNSMKRKEMETAMELEQKQVDGLSSDAVVAYHTYLKRLSERIANQVTVLIEIEGKASEKQAALVDAMKKRQILEKLKDQGLDRYNQMMLKKEMNFIDEIAVNQFVRKTIETSGDGQ